jgi:hypothetical protein
VRFHEAGSTFVRKAARNVLQGRQPAKATHFAADINNGQPCSASAPPLVRVLVTPDSRGNVWFSYEALQTAVATTPTALSFFFQKGWEAEFLKDKRCGGIAAVAATKHGT